MNRITDPAWLLRKANLALVVVPAVIGRAWAFENFYMTYFAVNGLFLGMIFAVLAVVMGGFAGHQVTPDYLLRKMRIIPLFTLLMPIAFVYGWLMLTHPSIYFPILAFFVVQVAVHACRALRGWADGLRADFA